MRARFWILGAWVVLLTVLVLGRQGGPGGDWLFFREGFALLTRGRADIPHRFTTVHLTGGYLHLYALHPRIQIGPLALLVAGVSGALDTLNRYLAPLVTAMIGLATVAGVERVALALSPGRGREVRKITLLGGLFLLYAWVQAFVQWRHLDDMLVLLGVLVAVAAVGRRRPWLLGAAVGLSVAAKPTALVLLPLLFALDRRRTIIAVLVAGALICACWLPFVIADPATLHAGVPQTLIRPGSGLTAVGFGIGAAPRALRVVQLLVTLVGGGLAVARGRWYLVPLLGFGLRTSLDPSMAGYYAVSVLLAAMIADLVPLPRSPMKTLLAWLAFSEAFPFPGVSSWPAFDFTVQAWLRLVVPLFLIAAAWRATPEVAGWRCGKLALGVGAGTGRSPLPMPARDTV